MPDDDEDLMLLPLVNLLSKEAFLTKRLTHRRTTDDIRKYVWDRLGHHRRSAELWRVVYIYVNQH
jgi:hypothetical protein